MKYIEISYYDKKDNTWKTRSGNYESVEQCLSELGLDVSDRGWQVNVNKEVTDDSIH